MFCFTAILKFTCNAPSTFCFYSFYLTSFTSRAVQILSHLVHYTKLTGSSRYNTGERLTIYHNVAPHAPVRLQQQETDQRQMVVNWSVICTQGHRHNRSTVLVWFVEVVYHARGEQGAIVGWEQKLEQSPTEMWQNCWSRTFDSIVWSYEWTSAKSCNTARTCQR